MTPLDTQAPVPIASLAADRHRIVRIDINLEAGFVYFYYRKELIQSDDAEGNPVPPVLVQESYFPVPIPDLMSRYPQMGTDIKAAAYAEAQSKGVFPTGEVT